MKTVFVTGGAGFIGSAFVRLLLEENSDFEIINFDALTYAGNLENLKEFDETRHKFVKGDITNREEVFNALPDGCEAIFNFAAESHVDRSINSASEFVLTNVLGTQVLLDAARAKNVRRFCQISTDEVMGSLPEDENTFFTEESPLKPNSPYAASKASAEHFVRAAHETFGVDTIITRCGNNYGGRQFPEKLIPLVIANAMNNEPIPLYGDGKYTRDWIFVEDHCRAIRLAFEKGKSGESYNIGARNERQNLDVVKSILDALGKPHSLIKFVTDRLGHDRRYAIDAGRVEMELGWKPRVSWEEGLQKTIQWYRENQDWVNRVRSGAYRDYYKNLYGMEVGVK
ncbi:MAG: dTDP-glucose 4,6-dehydratase [Acidobacteria bacterium]|nr:dTDP-glucose 4,6-dehydratase [Acidobacteriota bacterium]MCA1637608.1 dTDP-glucose 4,6-dehydratase [Acidobacteriota bacterium]